MQIAQGVAFYPEIYVGVSGAWLIRKWKWHANSLNNENEMGEGGK